MAGGHHFCRKHLDAREGEIDAASKRLLCPRFNDLSHSGFYLRRGFTGKQRHHALAYDLVISPYSYRVHIHRLDDPIGNRYRFLDPAAFFKQHPTRQRKLELGDIHHAKYGYRMRRSAKSVRLAMAFIDWKNARSPGIGSLCHRQLETGKTDWRINLLLKVTVSFHLSPSNKSASTFLPPFTKLKTR